MAKDESVVRSYNPRQDAKAVLEILREVAWSEGEEKKDKFWSLYIKSCLSIVGLLNGRAESLAVSVPGTLRHMASELPLCAVTAVVTSRVARKQGLASRATARTVAEAADQGAVVAGLGVFDAGFYDRLGFGTGSYEHWFTLDPSRLRIKTKHRAPVRIPLDKWREVHSCRLNRRKQHGACDLSRPENTQAEMVLEKNSFGLGYYQSKTLTHHVWLMDEGKEHGPYWVYWMAYQNTEQLLELLSLIRGLGDQVHAIKLREPPGIQLQDFIEQPFRQREISKGASQVYQTRASAYYQMRLLDLQRAFAVLHLPGEPLRFNLELEDPINGFLDADVAWRGVGGDYVLTLGPSSKIDPGREAGLPILKTNVGALTRLWLGVLPASGLAASDHFSAPPELLQQLDRRIQLPVPRPDWDF